MNILLLLLCALLLCALAYLFLIMPRMLRRPDASALMGRHYAHRGLHDAKAGIPENSMAAFARAVEAGYGIEFDVQLTSDRIPVVFHDETLERMCGVPGNVRDYSYAELAQIPLMGTDQCIPLLADVLDMVAGRVPLIIEIKIHEHPGVVCQKADQLIAAYKGPYCVESFHPLAVQWYREHRPQVIRGQLSADFNQPGRREPRAQMLVHHLLTNVRCRPDFIAYDHHARGNLSRRLCRSLFGALSVAWTVRSQQELDACKGDFDLFIFERFIPKE